MVVFLANGQGQFDFDFEYLTSLTDSEFSNEILEDVKRYEADSTLIAIDLSIFDGTLVKTYEVYIKTQYSLIVYSFTYYVRPQKFEIKRQSVHNFALKFAAKYL